MAIFSRYPMKSEPGDNDTVLIYDTVTDTVKQTPISAIEGGGGSDGVKILYATKSAWDAQRSLIAKAGNIYVYTDYKTYGNITLQGVKIGDGATTLYNLPFLDVELQNHIDNSNIHVTAAEHTKIEGLGDLSQKDSASGTFTPDVDVSVSIATYDSGKREVSQATSGTVTYTPAGSVAAPTITKTTDGSTTTIKNPTSKTVVTALAAALPGATAPSNPLTYVDVDGETLRLYQVGAKRAASITTSNVTVKTGDATYTASAPAFTGTAVRLETENIDIPRSFSTLVDADPQEIEVS